MTGTELLRSEAAHYRELAAQLRADFDVDDETLKDTLEGLSDLPELIAELVRSGLDDEALADALKGRMADMNARLNRLQTRAERKRELARWAMEGAGLRKLEAEDFSVGLRQGPPRLAITDETQIPRTYLLPQPPKLDRQGLAAALKRGEAIEGACLETGPNHISVRTK